MIASVTKYIPGRLIEQSISDIMLRSTALRYLCLFGNELIQPVVLLAFRLNWGWKLHQSGTGKLRNHSGVVEFFSSLGIPLPELNAWFVGGVESIGGILLLLGLLSRPTALLVSGVMFVAYISVEDDRSKLINIFSDPDAFIAADPFFFLLTALLVLAFGPGKISVDWLLARLGFRFFQTAGACCKPTE